MRTERIFVGIDDYRLEALLEASEATGRTVEQLIQEAVSKFLDEKRSK